jgi:hypothetical protein
MVEFSEGNLDFTTIIRTRTVEPEELPIQESFFGDTQYSARVKAVTTDGIEDSKWSAVTIRTSPEQIFLPLANADIGINEVTLNWPAGEFVTRFVANPGNIEQTITAGEVAAGEATITGLNYYTNYTVTMYAGNSQRGNIVFKTLMDPDCPTCVKLNSGEDIIAAIAGAADGSTIVLASGTYSPGQIVVSKSITLQAEVYYQRPLVNGQIACNAAVNSIAVRDIIFDGTASVGQFFLTQTGCNLTTLTVDGSEIRNYTNSLISANVAGAVFGDVNISNCYAHSITGGGGDGIDFRQGTITSLTVQNCTFASGFRTFLRMQLACNVSFIKNTFYKVCIGTIDGNNAGLFRVNSASSTFEVSSCLFVETGRSDADPAVNGGVWCRSNNMGVAAPVYSNNNIFSCYNIYAGLYTSASEVSATELSPGFVDAANGDFTVTNQVLIDREVGDPRWR